MSVKTQQMTRAMHKAADKVSAFASSASKSIGGFGAQMASAGRATAGVIDEFYIAPLRKAGRFIGGVGKSLGKSLGWAGKGMAGPLKLAGGAMGQMAVESARVAGVLGRMGRVGLKGAAFGFRMVGAAAGKAVAAMRETVNALGKGAMIGGGIAAAGLYKAATAASSLAEQTDRARSTFGPAADHIIAQSKAMGTAFGISRSEFVRSASELGGMAQGFGYASDEAAQLGVHLTKLALDASSRFQIPVAEAMERMASGFKGESEAVSRWGVDLQEANLKIKAQKMGLKLLGSELTQAQKTQVRVALIEEKLAGVHGDLAKTADSAENATKGLMGRLENLAATIGTALLPIVGSAMVELQSGVEALSMAWTSMTAGVVNDQVGVVGAMGESTKAMGWFQKSVGFVADAFQTLKIGFYYVQSYITSAIGQMVKGFGVLAQSIDNVLGKIGMGTGAGNFLNTYADDLKRLSAAQYEVANRELAKPAASEGVNAAFSAAQDRIKAMRTEAMKPGADVTKFVPKAETKAKDPKFASAMAAGSKEAANTVLRSQYGSTVAKGPQEETAKNTKETNRLLGQVVVKLGGGGVGGAAGGALAGVLGGLM